MQPAYNTIDQFIHNVMSVVINTAATQPERLKLLPAELRETIRKITHNTDNIFTNQNPELHRQLAEIHVILLSPESKRDESTGANIMRGFKSLVGARIDTNELKNELLNEKAEYREKLLLDVHSILSQEILSPTINQATLPQETQKLLNNLLWAHLDLNSKNTSDKAPLIKAYQEFNQNVSKLGNPKIEAYLKSISDYIKDQHPLGIKDGVPSYFLTEEAAKKLDQIKFPPGIQQQISNLIWEHTKLIGQKISQDISLGDPIFIPFMMAHVELSPNLEALGIEDEKFMKSIVNILRVLQSPNTQRPFLGFDINQVDKGQISREEENQAFLIESTKNKPLEHQWAKEGFVTPIPGFNMWEKTSLVKNNEEDYTLLIQTRINPKGHENTEMERAFKIPISLIPFRTDIDTPLTQEQQNKLLSFFRTDTRFAELSKVKQDEKMAELASMEFLSPDQRRLLLDMHTKLALQVTESLLQAYQR